MARLFRTRATHREAIFVLHVAYIIRSLTLDGYVREIYTSVVICSDSRFTFVCAHDGWTSPRGRYKDKNIVLGSKL